MVHFMNKVDVFQYIHTDCRKMKDIPKCMICLASPYEQPLNLSHKHCRRNESKGQIWHMRTDKAYAT